LGKKVRSPDDGDALALTFAAVVAPAEIEKSRVEDEYGSYGGSISGTRSSLA
jgi:hypothetical protein